MQPDPIRFQHAPWYIKAWRLRFYLRVPYHAVMMWRRSRRLNAPFNGFAFCWGIAVGYAQVEMHWWYTTDEALRHKE